MPFDWDSLTSEQTEKEVRLGFNSLVDEQKMAFFEEYFRGHTDMMEEVDYLIEKIQTEDENRNDRKEVR